MVEKKSKFALYFGNRGFFPSSLMAQARKELPKVLNGLGHETLMLDAEATRFGAVETPAEGEIYARFLREHAGKFDGVILSLPNFGDETGAVAALRDANVPILIQAYPDEMDKMSPDLRRDSFCGKFSVMDVFFQNGIKFTALKPHTVNPAGKTFAKNVDYFDRICRVTGGLKRMVVGAFGARTSAFKTVRIDELALQKHGITMETFDLSSVFAKMKDVDEKSIRTKTEKLESISNCKGIPPKALETLARLGVVLDNLIAEYKLDAVALRCWVEMQQILGISPCVLLGELNERGIAAACEVDVGNAIAMHALKLASGTPSGCLDWNNNYGDQEDKCILFHCGPMPLSMMTAKGTLTGHDILSNTLGEGCSFGCNVGRIAPTPFTFSSMTTTNGNLRFYVGQGEFTNDPIPKEFFGCAGVAYIDKLQDVLRHIGYGGHRHHVSVTSGSVADVTAEALNYYLGFEVTAPQK